jgi:hypothetical protein
MEIQRSDGFVVQSGKPDKGDGFVSPDTEKERIVPLGRAVATRPSTVIS